MICNINLKFEIKHLMWHFKMFARTRHIFYLRLVIAQFKDIKRNLR
jgi:hypothetical protein